MLKISLTQLEEVRKNPLAYRERNEGKDRAGRNPTIYSGFRNALFEFHKTSNFSSAMDYLESHLEKFSDQKKCQKAVSNLLWYVEEYKKLNWPLIQTKLNVVIPLSTKYQDSIRLSGQVSRLDINPQGGYAAWLFRSKSFDNWKNELQMPIIQNAVGVVLGKNDKPPVVVGVVSFEEHYIGFHEYSEIEIAQAHSNLEGIFRQMGY